MAFIYEVNGQKVEFDREPTDADIDEAARNLNSTPAAGPNFLEAGPQPQEYAATQAAMSGARPAAEAALGVGKFGLESVKNVTDIGRNMLNWTPQAWKEVATHPIETAKAYVQTMPAFANAPGATTGQMVRGGVGQMAGAAGRALGSVVAAPENLFTLPYTMAGYEQEKIRSNPTAPEYQYTPYAQAYRGEYPTQGAAAAANRRQAIAGQQYGGLSEQEQNILQSDRLNMAIRLKAAKKVLGQP